MNDSPALAAAPHPAESSSRGGSGGGGGLFSFHIQRQAAEGEGGAHKIKLRVDLGGGGGKPKSDPDHPNWKIIDQAMAMNHALQQAEAADEVDDDTAAANLAKRESTVARLLRGDPELVRLDVGASLYAEVPDFDEFLDKLESSPHIQVVHLSGLGTRDAVHPDDFVATVEAIGSMPNLTELFVFRGTSQVLDEALLAKCLTLAQKLKVLMIWGYGDSLAHSQALAGALRMHPALERLTVTLPPNLPYGCLDMYSMAFCGMPQLSCLNVRVHGQLQTEPVLSPEAATLLLNSRTIDTLYLENLGLTDDHSDAIFAELKNVGGDSSSSNTVLKALDLKGNQFSDDAIYTLAQTLPHNTTLTTVDLSGVPLTDAAGDYLAARMASNQVIQYLELEGTEQRYQDEFFIPTGHEVKPWGKLLDYHLRLNRAGHPVTTRADFIEALNSVSDHYQCLYTIVRAAPKYCNVRPGAEM